MTSGLADSGAREVAENGFTREPDVDRRDLSYLFSVRGLDLVPPEIITRIAGHFANGAEKYEADNWRRGTDPAALARYKRSITRHIFQWFRGEQDEDHAAAVAWNLFVYEINVATAEDEWTNLDDSEISGNVDLTFDRDVTQDQRLKFKRLFSREVSETDGG